MLSYFCNNFSLNGLLRKMSKEKKKNHHINELTILFLAQLVTVPVEPCSRRLASLIGVTDPFKTSPTGCVLTGTGALTSVFDRNDKDILNHNTLVYKMDRPHHSDCLYTVLCD